MGAWGYKTLDNDSALDMVGDINEGIIKILRKDLKTKRFETYRGKRSSREDHVSPRVVANYIIKMYKSNMAHPFELREIAEDTIVALEKVKDMTENYEPQAEWEKAKLVEFKRETKKELNKEIRMLRKIIEADPLREVVKISKRRSRSNKSKSKKGSKKKSQRGTRRKVS